MPTDFVRVDFACNDEHGIFMGRAERINIGETEFECTLWNSGVSLRFYRDGTTYPNPNVKGRVKVGRISFWHNGHKYGVGNWCWDGVWLEEKDALKLVNYLMRQKYWSCTLGPEVPFDKFDRKEPFTIEDLRDCL